MAGTCYGVGLVLDGNGRIALDGPRQDPWGGVGGRPCSLAGNNGLRVDTGTNKLWVAPASLIKAASLSKANRTLNPATEGTTILAQYDQSITAPTCERGLWQAQMTGGFMEFLAVDENYWHIDRFITLTVDGVIVGFTGTEVVGSIYNYSGGYLGHGGPIENRLVQALVDPAETCRIQVTYSLVVEDVTAGGGFNRVQWRPPVLETTMWGYPIP